MLVSGGGDHTVRLWDLTTGEPRGTFIGHRAPALAVAMELLSGGDDGRIGVWDTDTWELSTMIDTTGYPLSIAAARVAGQLVLAIGGYWGTLSLWGLHEQTFLRQLDGRTVLATAGDDGGGRTAGGAIQRARINTLRSFEPCYRKELDADTAVGFRHSALISALVYGEVLGGVLAAGTRDGSLTLSHATIGEHVRDLPSHFAAIRALAFGTVNGHSILVSCGDEGIQAISFPHSAMGVTI